MTNIEMRVKQVLSEFANDTPIDQIASTANLATDLGMDSLDRVELQFAFEDEFGIVFEDAEALAITTVQQWIDAISLRCGATTGAQP